MDLFNKKRVAALEAGIARLFKAVYTIDGVLRPGGFWDFSNGDDLAMLNRWVGMIEEAHKNKVFEDKVKNIVDRDCPNKKKGAK